MKTLCQTVLVTLALLGAAVFFSCTSSGPLGSSGMEDRTVIPVVTLAKTLSADDVYRAVAVVTGDNIQGLRQFELDIITSSRAGRRLRGELEFPATGSTWTVEIRMFDAKGRKTGQGSVAITESLFRTGTYIAEVSIAVNSALPRIDTLWSRRATVLAGDSIYLHATASDSFGGRIVRYEWKIGEAGVWQERSGDDTVFVAPNKAGLVLCTLKVTDDDDNQVRGGLVVAVVERPTADTTVPDSLFEVTVTVDGEGTVIADPPDTTFLSGTTVTLTATPGEGYYFAGWSGGVSSTDPVVEIIMTADTAVTATFVRSSHTFSVTVDGEGTVIADPPDTTFLSGTIVTLTATPGEGYYFAGWSGGVSSTDPVIEVVMTADTAVTATFAQIGRYALTVTAPNGTVSKTPDSTDYAEGTQVTLTARPNAGYRFLSWRGASEGVDSVVTVTMDATKSVTAQFERLRYVLAVAAPAGEGVIVAPSVVPDTVIHGEATIITARPAAGYAFVRWVVVEGFAQLVTAIDSSTTVTLTEGSAGVAAEFEKKTYTVSFDAQGGDSVPDDTTVRHGEAFGELPEPSKTGHVFDGWWTSADGEGTRVTAATMVTGNTTMYAKWTPKICIVDLDSMGGSGGANRVTATYGSPLPPATAPTRTGHIFAGYYDASYFGVQYYTAAMASVRNWDKTVVKTTLYARWKPATSAVTLDRQGGSGGTVGVVTTYGSPMPMATAPTRTGHSFAGYWDATSGGVQYYTAFMTSARNWDKAVADTTLYALWTLENYAITYRLNGGTNHSGNPSTYTIESELITLLDAERPGFSFSGWYADSLYETAVSTIPVESSGDKTFYARWTWGGGTVTDVDGNVYTTVQIGNQVWTVENLRTTRFSNGDSIPFVTDYGAWDNLSTAGYCFFGNSTDTDYQTKFGAIYNWHSINTGKLAPAGWRVPTERDWSSLKEYLIANGYNHDGSTSGNKIAKSLAAQTDWEPWSGVGVIGNDFASNNSTGFSALPVGYRALNGYFINPKSYVGFWSATVFNTSYVYVVTLASSNEDFNMAPTEKGLGHSVRLVRD